MRRNFSNRPLRITPALSFFAQGIGTPGEDIGQAITTDPVGNIYVAGFFSGAADFDPRPDFATSLTSRGGNDAFVTKYDPAGTLLWAKGFGSTGSDQATGVAVDGAGNVVVAGGFEGTVDFDPSNTGVQNRSSHGGGDIFVAKLDTNGNFVFAVTVGGGDSDRAEGVALDAAGNIYSTGSYRGNVDFNFGSGTSILAGSANANAFVWKITAAGGFGFAQQTGRPVDTGASAFGTDIAVDATGNIYTCGGFGGGTVDFNPNPQIQNLLTTTGMFDAYVSKIGADGVYQFAKQYRGLNANPLNGSIDSATANGIAVDAGGNIFVAGSFFGTVDVDPGDATLPVSSSGGTNDCFVLKLKPDGSLDTNRRIGGPFGTDLALDIAVASDNTVFVTGAFTGTVDFDPSGGGTFFMTSNSASKEDIFVLQLNNSLQFRDAGSAGSPAADDRGRAVAVHTVPAVRGLPATTKAYITGGLLGATTFGSGPGAPTVNSVENSRDAFVAGFDLSTTRPADTIEVGAGAGGGQEVQMVGPAGTATTRIQAFDASLTGGVRTASADLNGDNVPDLIAGSGPGGPPLVRAFDGATGAMLFEVPAFEASFTGGVFVTTGDFNGDGTPDVVVTPDEGGGPRVRIFSGRDQSVIADFFGIADPAFHGGARAAVGDLNGDGTPDLLVGAGFGGGPRVAGFEGGSLATGTPAHLFGDFFVFEQSLRNGVFLTAGDLDGDGKDDAIFGGGPGGGPRVFALSGQGLTAEGRQVQLANFFAGDDSNRGGVRVSAKGLDGDARADLVTGAGTGSSSVVTTFAGSSILVDGTPPTLRQFSPFDGGFLGGVFVG
jgi:hypothetical protein